MHAQMQLIVLYSRLLFIVVCEGIFFLLLVPLCEFFSFLILALLLSLACVENFPLLTSVHATTYTVFAFIASTKEEDLQINCLGMLGIQGRFYLGGRTWKDLLAISLTLQLNILYLMWAVENWFVL